MANASFTICSLRDYSSNFQLAPAHRWSGGSRPNLPGRAGDGNSVPIASFFSARTNSDHESIHNRSYPTLGVRCSPTTRCTICTIINGIPGKPRDVPDSRHQSAACCTSNKQPALCLTARATAIVIIVVVIIIIIIVPAARAATTKACLSHVVRRRPDVGVKVPVRSSTTNRILCSGPPRLASEGSG
jgi:hypothetical protein